VRQLAALVALLLVPQHHPVIDIHVIVTVHAKAMILMAMLFMFAAEK
jgi:hypothetical protein